MSCSCCQLAVLDQQLELGRTVLFCPILEPVVWTKSCKDSFASQASKPWQDVFNTTAMKQDCMAHHCMVEPRVVLACQPGALGCAGLCTVKVSAACCKLAVPSIANYVCAIVHVVLWCVQACG